MFISNKNYNKMMGRLNDLERNKVRLERTIKCQAEEINRALRRGKLLLDHFKLEVETISAIPKRVILVKKKKEKIEANLKPSFKVK